MMVLETTDKNLDLSHLSEGLYFIVVSNKMRVIKIIKN
jgi:hypothetical protein